MNVKPYPLTLEDLYSIRPRAVHAATHQQILKHANAVLKFPNSYSIMSASGVLVAVGGLLPTGCMWALVNEEAARPHALALVRETRRLMDEAGVPIYAEVKASDKRAVRFVEALGFVNGSKGKWHYASAIRS